MAEPDATTAPPEAAADRPSTETGALPVVETEPTLAVIPGAATKTLIPVRTVTDPMLDVASSPVTEIDTFCGTITSPT
jgi:hypothetical protein